MGLKNFEKSRIELNKKNVSNIENINLSSKNKKIAAMNSSEFKLLCRLILAVSTFVLLSIVTNSCFETIDVYSITKFISPKLVAPIVSLTSIFTGFIGQKIIARINKSKNRFKENSKSKTDIEQQEEFVRHKVEYEKSNNKKLVLEKALNILEANEKTTSILSDNYIIKENIKQKIMKKSLANNIQNLEDFIEKMYEDLDNISTKKIISNEFSAIIDEEKKFLVKFISVGLGFFFGFMHGNLANNINVFLGSNNLFYAITNVLANILVPCTLGALGGYVYDLQKRKKQEKLFNKLNNQLCGNSISKNQNQEDFVKDQEKKINEIINNLAVSEYQLQVHKRLYEKICNQTSIVDDDLLPEKNNKKENNYVYSDLDANKTLNVSRNDDFLITSDPVILKKINKRKKK